MSSRSPSSSPDVLGPPGDADYLISSPFVGRQSWVSPASFRSTLTPRKRQRITLSPAKSAHSVRFDDVLLPTSPTMKLNGRQRSLSPGKGGMGSPWRIRVMLEASQEDGMNDAGSARKKVKGAPKTTTTTVKVPLKGDGDQKGKTPRRRRSRSRKSDPQGQPSTPNGATGSPGHTPSSRSLNGQGRKRSRTGQTQLRSSSAQAGESRENLEPMNLAADEIYDEDSVGGTPARDLFVPIDETRSSETPARHGSLSVRPGDNPAHDAVEYGESDVHSQSPTMQESSTHENRGISTTNSLHAGHTPLPRRTGRLPQTSSLHEDGTESLGVFYRADRTLARNDSRVAQERPDPTDEHFEFDSIMESEGFSMVSLDSLSSTKQHALSASSKVLGGALKPFLKRQSGIGVRTGGQTPARTTRLNYQDPAPEVANANSTSPSSLPINPFPDLSPQSSPQGPSEQKMSGLRDPPVDNSSDPAFSHESPSNLIEMPPHSNSRLNGETANEAFQPTHQTQTPPQSPSYEQRMKMAESEMRQREEEWQREREAVSRAIEMANSSQVIVIDSDRSTPRTSHDTHSFGSGAPSDSGSEPGLGLNEDELEEEQELADEDDGYEDIWQLEAKSRTGLPHSYSTEKPESQSVTSENYSRRPAVTWSRRLVDVSSDNSNTFSPAHWAAQNEDVLLLGESKVKRFREQEVDLSTLLHASATPNRSQYYSGTPSTLKAATTTPLSVGSKPQVGSEKSNKSPSKADNRSSQSPSRAVEDEVRTAQGSDWSEPSAQGNDQNPSSPGPVPETDHIDETNAAIDDASGTITATDPVQPVKTDRRPSSWFQTLTSITPDWVRAPNHGSKKNPDTEPQATIEQLSDLPSLQDPGPSSGFNGSRALEGQQPGPLNMDSNEKSSLPATQAQGGGRQSSPELTPRRNHVALAPRDDVNVNHTTTRRSKSLSLSGYFTDDHYIALRQLYLVANRSPELFPYSPSPARDEMIGDWIWTSDGAHGVPVTAGQFAVIDRFVDDLVQADVQSGGSGQVGWTDADLHKRLISIIIGKQIRRERKSECARRESNATIQSVMGVRETSA